MLKTILLFSFFLLAGWGILIATKPAGSTKVAFADLDWTTAKQKATAENKLFFVDFDASYCMTCRNMDKTTFMDNELADYISKNVVALSVDVQDFDGVGLAQEYNVEALPTMLVFDGKGNLQHRFVGYKSAKDLIKTFQETQAKTEPVTNTTPDQPLGYEPANNAKAQKINANHSLFAKTVTTTNLPQTAEAKIISDLATLFEISVRKQEAKGFSVQVGSFSSYEMVLDQAEMMRELYEQKTIVNVDKSVSPVKYRLLVGNFATRADAQKFQEILKKNKMDGIVKDLQTL